MPCRLFELYTSITFFRSKIKLNPKNLFLHKYINSHDIHCKSRNRIYFLTCKHYNKKDKSGCETLSITIKVSQRSQFLHSNSAKSKKRWSHKWSARLCCAKASSPKRRLSEDETAYYISSQFQ